MSHKHNYKLIRAKEETDARGVKYLYRFYRCYNPGCPHPDKMEVVRSMFKDPRRKGDR